MKLSKLLFDFTKNRPAKIITRDAKPYLERYFLCHLERLGITCYLHRFVSSDGDKDLHDHPWNALALCLTGGYIEERLIEWCILNGPIVKLRKISPFKINLLKSNATHRIAKVKPETWTLFIHFKVRKGWGFYHVLPDIFKANYINVHYHQPFKLTHGAKWWEFKETVKGRELKRAPYNA